MESKKYQPSNGMEGDIFINEFCKNCKNELFIHTGGEKHIKCKILTDSLSLDINDEKYPLELIKDENGIGKCSKYDFKNQFDENLNLIEVIQAEFVDPNQLDLFE